MSQTIPKLLLDTHFKTVEEYVLAVKGWDIDFIQLDPGDLDADLQQIVLGPVMLGRYAFNRRFHQRGASPCGVRTFGLVDPPGVNWCGRMTGEDTVLVFPAASDYESFSDPGFSARTISISEDKLNTVSEAFGLPTIEDIAGSDDFAIQCNHGRVASLRKSIDNACAMILEIPELLDQSSLYNKLNYEIPMQLLRTLSQSREKLIVPPGSRLRAINMAWECIEHNQGEVSIKEICQVTGVSWRTLDYAFKERIGIGPKKYLEAYRLNRVHRELSLSQPDVKIADIANQFGYWHMGRFACNYREFFGELPSETLSKRHKST